MDRLLLDKKESLSLFKNESVVVTQNFLGPFIRDDQTVEHICQHIGHPWAKGCFHGSLKLFLSSLKGSGKIYASLYILSAVLRGRSLKYWFTKLPREIIRSTVFLAANCGLYIAFFCVGRYFTPILRKYMGGVSYYGTFLASLFASLLAILIERKQRRGLLALYLTNLASETGFKMMVSRKWIKSIPNGEVALFALGSAIYAFLFKMLIGPSECLNVDHSLHRDRKSRVVKYYGLATSSLTNFLQLVYNLTIARTSRHHRSHNIFVTFLRSIERRLDTILTSFSHDNNCKHHLCNHRYNCFIYSIMGFFQRFASGFLLQLAIKCLSSIGTLTKKPSFILKLIKSPANKELGLFLGTYVLIFRALSCLLRWITNRNDEYQGFISGFFAGWSMLFYKSSSIALYINFKLLEILWMLGVENKKLPLFKSFDIVLYTISTAFVLWVALYEPHNIRPAYQRFLNNMSDRRFQQLNRYIIDAFGVKSSTMDETNVFGLLNQITTTTRPAN